MAFWKLLTFAGLLLNLIEGIRVTWTNPDKPNQELIRLERRWDFRSQIGLWCVIIGIAFQAFGVWISP
jgi:hypothetical protein